jgi:hypothetical protein
VLARAVAGLGLYPNKTERVVDVVVGAQYGSEGKGNICAYLAKEYDVLMRVGGPNAGHRVADPLRGLLRARAYRDHPQTVLTIRTATLVAAHSNRTLLSPINSGSTIYKPQPRGRDTFLPIADYPFDAWKKKRSRSKGVAELAVTNGVPDIMDHVLAVHRVLNGVTQELWRSPLNPNRPKATLKHAVCIFYIALN